MPQPTVAAYFNTRKRVAADDLSAATRSKVLVLEQHSGAGTESEPTADQKSLPETASSRVVFANTKNFLSKNGLVDGSGTPEGPRRVTRAARSIKRIGASTGSGGEAAKEQPKLVTFLKLGTLSPKKRLASPAKGSVPPKMAAASPAKGEFSAKTNTTNTTEQSMRTPTKIQPEVVPAPSAVGSGLSMDDLKSKLSKSSRLTELKTRLNKVQSGFDRLDRLEQIRLDDQQRKPAVPPSPGTAARNLKEFQTLEVEVPVSPQKRFASPTKTLHRTPTKLGHGSSLLSPQKTVTPKRLSLLMSPIKTPSATPVTASPTKVPAYQRFQSLVETGPPALQLPYKYRCLVELFKCIDCVCAMFHNRKEQITFKKLKPAVQRMARKNLYESHLAQIKTLFPEAFEMTQVLTKNYGSVTKYDYYQLVIKPNVEEKEAPAKPVDEDANVIRTAQNQSMNPQVMLERAQKFNRILLAKTKEAHEQFLLKLDPPVVIAQQKLTRWHPDFDLEKGCPDIAQTELPQPPNVERFASAKEVLSTARNLFNCATPMERALERLEQKKLQDSQQAAASSSGTSASQPEPPQTTTKKTEETPYQSVLKNVPQSLLEKIRAKQAAKALSQMTRRPSQEKEALKYSRLPEIARHLRNVFVTEKKNVLTLEAVLVKIENSYRGQLTLKELEEHLTLTSQIAPFWVSLKEVRKQLYVKIVKDCDLAKVIGLLEQKASDQLK